MNSHSGPYCYQVGYGTCEESCFKEFESEKLISYEELKQIVAECILETISELGMSSRSLMQDCMPNNKQFVEAMRKRGLTLVEYTATFRTFGWCDFSGKGRFKMYCDEEDLKFLSDIHEKLVEKENAKNRDK